MLCIPVGAVVLSGFQIEAYELGGYEELLEDGRIFSELIEDEKLSYELKRPEILQVEALLERTLRVIVKECCVHYKL